MSLCAECGPRWLAWLDYRLSPPPIQLMSINDSPREMAARAESRYRQWRDTVRFHQDLIVRVCAEGHQAGGGSGAA